MGWGRGKAGWGRGGGRERGEREVTGLERRGWKTP
jgi:hypothetical protein